MIKRTKTKVFDTDTATIVKKVTFSYYGDPEGYEITLYKTPEGDTFIYAYGGSESPFKKEYICRYTRSNAKIFLASTRRNDI